MRDVIRQANAARTLHAWLRRVALTAVPLAGLVGCGSDCDLPDYTMPGQVDGGVPWSTGSKHDPSECAPYCGQYTTHDVCYHTENTGCTASSQSTVVCNIHYVSCSNSPCGRLPAGLIRSDSGPPREGIAAYLSDSAHLEGAAVFAFHALERELRAHGAPSDLIARARSAQRDEARHQVAMSRLAARFGGSEWPVNVKPSGTRPLVDVAAENAAEGCVRETFGAAVAAWQAQWAEDRAVRRAMRAIARDEAEHAALGWAVDGWIRERLPPDAVERVDQARTRALESVRASARKAVPAELSAVLGLPDARASEHLFSALAPLWS